VRAGAVGTIPAASLAFAKSITAPTTLTVVSAPSAAATVRINNGSATPATGDDSATLTSPLSSLGSIFGTVVGDDTVIGLSADTAGSYTARLSNGADTVTFSFVTTGAPTSLALTPATQTVLVGAEGALVATLKDASGNVTQPAVVDSVALSDNTDDTLSTATLTSANLAKGTAAFTLATTGNPAGTTTITATPQGTLPGTGVTAANVIAFRKALDDGGFKQPTIVASSGFDVLKCRIFANLDVPVDIVGTGSYMPSRLSATYATADIVEYAFEDEDGVFQAHRLVKVGREHLIPTD
jgi:hypothetical protein